MKTPASDPIRTLQPGDPIPPAPVDPHALAELETVMGDGFGELIETYLAHSPILLRDLAAGIEAGDPPKQNASVHALKSSSALLGARVLSELAAGLEAQTSVGQSIGAEQLGELVREFERVRAWLAERGEPPSRSD